MVLLERQVYPAVADRLLRGLVGVGIVIATVILVALPQRAYIVRNGSQTRVRRSWLPLYIPFTAPPSTLIMLPVT